MATPEAPIKTRLLWSAIMAIGLTALYCGIFRPQVSTIPKNISEPMAEIKPPMPALPELPPLPVPEVPTIEPPPLKSLPLIEPALPLAGSAKIVPGEGKK